MSSCVISHIHLAVVERATHDTVVLGNTAKSDTGPTDTGDVSHSDRARVGFERNAVVTSLVDKVFCGINTVPFRNKTRDIPTVTL